jgi:WD40 repeat protein
MELLGDCQRFIREFFPVLSVASSHTYYSALPFTPRESALHKIYGHELKQSVKVYCGVGNHWDPCLRTIEGHDHAVMSVTVSPDGTHVLSGSYDTSVRLWDFVTGVLLHRFTLTDSAPVLSVAFSPSGAHIAAGLRNSLVHLWDVESGEHLLTLRGHTDKVSAVVFSPDGMHVASGSYDGKVRIWDAATGVNVKTIEGHAAGVTSLAYSPTGAYISSGFNNNTFQIQRSNGNHRKTITGHSRAVTCVTYSSDGSKIFSGSYDGKIRMWDTAGVHLKTFDGATGSATLDPPVCIEATPASHDVWVHVDLHPTDIGYAQAISSIAYSPDGRRLASALGRGAIQLWDTTGGHFQTLNGHSSAVLTVSYTPDGTQIVSGSYDGTIRIWNAIDAVDKHPNDSGLAKHLGLVALSPSRIATGFDSSGHDPLSWRITYLGIDLWDISGRHISRLQGFGRLRIAHLVFSYDATHLAAVSDSSVIAIFSGQSGRYLRSIDGDRKCVLMLFVNSYLRVLKLPYLWAIVLAI